MRRSVLGLAALGALVTVLTGPASAGVSGPAFYVEGEVYRTVGTPTDLSTTGAPAGSFDTIYEFDGAQLNLATAAPGDPGYNGGRWLVHLLVWTSTYQDAVTQHGGTMDPSTIDTNAEIAAVLADVDGTGGATTMVVKSFVCPVIPVPGA
jgi:hypothetical protein